MSMKIFVLLLVVTEVCGFVNLVNPQSFKRWVTMGAKPQYPNWEAIKAVDGNTNQSYEFDSCAITDIDVNCNTSIWWMVLLESKFNIAYLEIYFRSDTFSRSTGFSIYTYDTENSYPLRDPKRLVYHHNPLFGCPAPIQNVTINYVTQGLLFTNERPQGYTSNCPGDNLMCTAVELCEIKVMGCEQSRFSPGCSRSCPSKCKNQHCDAFNGSCKHGCSNPNALTVDCTENIECEYGMYIQNKTCVQCGHCKDGVACNKSTGRCDNGCENNLTGNFCINNEEMASDLKFYVPIVSLAVFLAIAVGVVIYQRRQISVTPLQSAPAESTNQQKQKTNTPHYINLVFTEEGHEYRSLNIVE
ncbi:uncharacterized protein LOC111114377 [Crassostrea virginica]